LLALRALAPPPAPPYALPEEEEREAEGLGRDAPVDALGRLADGVPVDGRVPAAPVEGRAPAAPVDGRAPAAPVEGRAPLVPVEGRAPPEPQPRASALRAEAAAVGEPLLPRRLWSGCHFFWVPVDDGLVPAPSRFTFLLTF